MRELREVRPPSELRPTDDQRTAPERRPLPETDRVRITHAEIPRPDPARSADSTHGTHEKLGGARDELARFKPRRCGLPDVPKGDAADYIEANRAERPWLNSARNAPGDVQRVFAALDQGGGHAHIRHEGWLSAEKSQMRVLGLQDPAQLDPEKRASGIDGLASGKKSHYCAAESTAIRDPTAFALSFSRGVEHPEIRKALDTGFEPGKPGPLDVGIPITELLGQDGHRYCEGYRLVGDADIARHDRRTWLRETRAGDIPSVPPPLVVPVDFQGGTIQFRFKINTERTGYEIATMFPTSPDRQPDSD